MAAYSNNDCLVNWTGLLRGNKLEAKITADKRFNAHQKSNNSGNYLDPYSQNHTFYYCTVSTELAESDLSS